MFTLVQGWQTYRETLLTIHAYYIREEKPEIENLEIP